MASEIYEGRRRPQQFRLEELVGGKGEEEVRNARSPRIKFHRIRQENLEDAIRAAQSAFREPADREAIDEAYRLSARGDIGGMKRAGFRTMSYWTAASPGTPKRIHGVTGLEEYLEDPPDRVRLGWFGTVPESRGKGFGRAILKRTIAKARTLGRDRLRLWTTMSADEVPAQVMYEDFGFHIVDDEEARSVDPEVIIREKDLR